MTVLGAVFLVVSILGAMFKLKETYTRDVQRIVSDEVRPLKEVAQSYNTLRDDVIHIKGWIAGWTAASQGKPRNSWQPQEQPDELELRI